MIPIAHFRKTFLIEIQELFVQILLLAQSVGVLRMGNISLDGSENSCGCFQEPRRELWTSDRTRDPIEGRSAGIV